MKLRRKKKKSTDNNGSPTEELLLFIQRLLTTITRAVYTESIPTNPLDRSRKTTAEKWEVKKKRPLAEKSGSSPILRYHLEIDHKIQILLQTPRTLPNAIRDYPQLGS